MANRLIRAIVIGLFALVALVALPALAEDSPTLDQLFVDLRNAKSVEEGRAIETRIVRLWSQSGDQKVDEMMGWAIAAMDLQSFTLALNYLDAIVVTKPDFIEGWNKRATVYFYIGDDERSLADIAKTLTLEPRHFGALAGLGMIKERQGEYEAAIAAFQRVLELNPNLEDIRLRSLLLEDKIRKKA